MIRSYAVCEVSGTSSIVLLLCSRWQDPDRYGILIDTDIREATYYMSSEINLTKFDNLQSNSFLPTSAVLHVHDELEGTVNVVVS